MLRPTRSYGLHHHHHHNTCCMLHKSTSLCFSPKPISSLLIPNQNSITFHTSFSFVSSYCNQRKRKGLIVEASSSSSSSSNAANSNSPLWESWKPQSSSSSPSLSDIFWPSAGAFAAMAILGKVDQLIAPQGLSMTVAPLGAVSAVLFATPSSPAARKYNMFMAQIGCAAIGVLALSIFGTGWLARSAALSASLAFMIYTRSPHPPAASLPLLFIDGAKFHHLNYWYILFPGAAGCLLLCAIREIVMYLKDNIKF